MLDVRLSWLPNEVIEHRGFAWRDEWVTFRGSEHGYITSSFTLMDIDATLDRWLTMASAHQHWNT